MLESNKCIFGNKGVTNGIISCLESAELPRPSVHAPLLPLFTFHQTRLEKERNGPAAASPPSVSSFLAWATLCDLCPTQDSVESDLTLFKGHILLKFPVVLKVLSTSTKTSQLQPCECPLFLLYNSVVCRKRLPSPSLLFLWRARDRTRAAHSFSSFLLPLRLRFSSE